MIYITGDTHGELDRFKSRALRGLGKNDVLFVLGDFGFLWDDGREEKKRLDWLAKRPYTILFLDGTHENYEMLDALPVEEKFGGRVQPVAGSVYHVCRGSILELEGMSFLCFGGGESPDKEERDPGVNWWPREMPSDEEYAFCDANVAAQADFSILPSCLRGRTTACTAISTSWWGRCATTGGCSAATTGTPSSRPRCGACSATWCRWGRRNAGGGGNRRGR